VGGARAVIAAPADLPRLLYIGDVTVADTLAGEALLFRLLQSYPPDKLALVCGVRPDAPLLPGATYHHWGAAFPRLLYSRVGEEYILFRAWKYFEVPRRIAAIATLFRPDAILTISHVSGWLCAWQLAADRGVPLHIVAHDDLVYASRFPRWARSWAERKFGEAYRAARSRLCISEAMAEQYAGRFGAPGTVLYPTRGRGQQLFTTIAPRVSRTTSTLTFAYAGSINSPEQFAQILAFAGAAGAGGHRVIAYTPQEPALRGRAAAVPALDLRAPLLPGELPARLRDEADCLLLPQPFDDAERAVSAMSFPSKWVDYSGVGMPMLVWAPGWSVSADFAARHPGCVELVTSSDERAVAAAIERLAGAPDYRVRLAERVMALGAEAFAPETAWRTFWTALQS
jgi:hypothetical protein